MVGTAFSAEPEAIYLAARVSGRSRVELRRLSGMKMWWEISAARVRIRVRIAAIWTPKVGIVRYGWTE